MARDAPPARLQAGGLGVYGSKTQPRGFYEYALEYIPNAADVQVTYLPGGHFWTLESPSETTAVIRQLLAM
jgi:hypothetical protein